MNKQEYILFIFEGKKVEPMIFENFKKYFLKKKESSTTQHIIVKYGTVIYTLYKKFFIDDKLDEDLDLVALLKPTNDDSEIIKREDVSEIYLFLIMIVMPQMRMIKNYKICLNYLIMN